MMNRREIRDRIREVCARFVADGFLSPSVVDLGDGPLVVETDGSGGFSNLQVASTDQDAAPLLRLLQEVRVRYGSAEIVLLPDGQPAVRATVQRITMAMTLEHVPPEVTQGTPAYMQSLVAQVSDETVERWIALWHMPQGSTRDDLALRVTDYGHGDETTDTEARELAAAIMADIGQERIDGARRADRSSHERHMSPDTAEDLDHHDGCEEPLMDSDWFRDLAAATEKRQEEEG